MNSLRLPNQQDPCGLAAAAFPGATFCDLVGREARSGLLLPPLTTEPLRLRLRSSPASQWQGT